MRLLVECPECARQYDASDRPPGSRFHCECAAVIEVQAPQGHDASVVRCSSCGGPRQEGSSACSFCQSDFTLHERDLHTVCPHCLARVSDKARYCHHCGTGLCPELSAGHDSPLVCPACADERKLISRRLGEEQVTVLECGACAGMWLGHDAFDLLVKRAKSEATPARVRVPPVRGLPREPGQPRDSFYRPCAVCRQLMSRQNYAQASGVIIDVCRHHGQWFDGHELDAILNWLRAGGGPPVEMKPKKTKRTREARAAALSQGGGDTGDATEFTLLAALEVLTSVFLWD